jgi:hypothetical protein
MLLSSFLNREYYLPRTIRLRLLISIGFSLVILLILHLFTPFGMHNIKTIPERFLVAFGYSFITFIVWFCSLSLLMLFHINQARSWHILLLILLIQFLTGIICTVYNNIIFSNPYYFEFFLDFHIFVLLTGIIPTTMLILFLETSFYKKQFSGKNLYHAHSNEKNENIITIEDENPEKSIDLIPREIVSISSMDNYIKIELQRNGEKLKPVVLRNTLKSVEYKICELEYFMRCHRSHIINLKWVKEVSGNSLTKKCIMQIGNSAIPISRSKVNSVLKRIRELNLRKYTIRP